eukprot:CAMPEP_0204586964 /NCGR_PEP_ID=MMETSP0661-20131031/47793_1 /ASSEMBLY_ACC=CAM_ASM_000606 /TAXON_ID=109239 /ORGANISM="Alexandrium margalefi, Strain AMGDE01CS-322" /LENGTH=38 /DNA_ID= /DNA_START= /DNA_END= /DNA_ORIENTATION=
MTPAASAKSLLHLRVYSRPGARPRSWGGMSACWHAKKK